MLRLPRRLRVPSCRCSLGIGDAGAVVEGSQLWLQCRTLVGACAATRRIVHARRGVALLGWKAACKQSAPATASPKRWRCWRGPSLRHSNREALTLLMASQLVKVSQFSTAVQLADDVQTPWPGCVSVMAPLARPSVEHGT